MKRELKGRVDLALARLPSCFTHHPDEEGTESTRVNLNAGDALELHTPSR